MYFLRWTYSLIYPCTGMQLCKRLGTKRKWNWKRGAGRMKKKRFKLKIKIIVSRFRRSGREDEPHREDSRFWRCCRELWTLRQRFVWENTVWPMALWPVSTNVVYDRNLSASESFTVTVTNWVQTVKPVREASNDCDGLDSSKFKKWMN